MSASAEVIVEPAALEALAPDWWALWRRCPTSTPFTSPAWLLAWQRAFEPGPLRTVTVRQDGRLVGLAPFWLEDGPLGRRLLPLGLGISDSFDILLDPDGSGETGAVLTAAVAQMNGWDLCELEELGEGAAGLALPVPVGCTDATAPQSASPVLTLTGAGDPDEAVPAAKRRKLRMARHRTARRSGAIGEVAPADIDAFQRDLARLHGARWTARGQAGVLADEAVDGFHAAALPALAEAGLARLFTLTIAEQVVGAYYGLQHGTRAFAYLGGFDPAYAFESPGTVLIGHAIADAARTGASEFDFLRGQEAYKYEWGAVDRWNVRRTFRRTGPGG